METSYKITGKYGDCVKYITTLEDGSTIETEFAIEALAEEMLNHIHNKMVRNLMREGIEE